MPRIVGRELAAESAQLAEQWQALIDQAARRFSVAGVPADDCQPMESGRLARPEAGLECELEALVIVAFGGREVVLRPGRGRHHLEGAAGTAEVTDPAMDLDRFASTLGAGAVSPDRMESAASPISARARAGVGAVDRSSTRPSHRRPSTR